VLVTLVLTDVVLLVVCVDVCEDVLEVVCVVEGDVCAHGEYVSSWKEFMA
jgi:hypothetical protein